MATFLKKQKSTIVPEALINPVNDRIISYSETGYLLQRERVTHSARTDRPNGPLLDNRNGDTIMTIVREFRYPMMRKSGNWFERVPSSSNVTTSRLSESTVMAQRAISKLQGSNINVGVSLGEMPETLNMIARRIRKAAELFRAIKSRDIQRIERALGQTLNAQLRRSTLSGKSTSAIGGLWLEYSFGWKPLMSDIYGALDHLSQRTKNGQVRIRVVAGDKPKWTPFDVPDPRIPRSSAGSIEPQEWKSWINQDRLGKLAEGPLCCYAVLNAIVVNPTMRELQELGLLNPLAVAWELVPFSFVVDWFTTVGDVVNGLTYDAGIRVRGFCTVAELRTVYRALGKVNSVYQEIHRMPVDTTYLWVPQIKPSRLFFPSVQRVANAAALVAVLR